VQILDKMEHRSELFGMLQLSALEMSTVAQAQIF